MKALPQKVIVGTAGEKAVKAYLKKIPQQAEGFYLRVTPKEIVVAGRDESGTFYGEQTLESIVHSSESIVNSSKYKEVNLLEDGYEIRDWPSVWLAEV